MGRHPPNTQLIGGAVLFCRVSAVIVEESWSFCILTTGEDPWELCKEDAGKHTWHRPGDTDCSVHLSRTSISNATSLAVG